MIIKSKDIQIVDIESLVNNPKNNNKHPKGQIERLAKLIKHHGFRNPIVVSNRTGFVVAGHGRVEAAKMAGLKEVPVMRQDFDNEAAEYAYLTSDNAVASWATLDMEMVNSELLNFPELDIELLGIEDFKVVVPEITGLVDADDVPEVVNPISRRGDIWLLGNHRLMCGDSTMIDDVEKLMNGKKADMVFTDPPYNQHIDAGFNGKSSMASLEKSNLNDFKPDEFMNVWGIVKPQTSYIFCSKNLIKNYIERIEDKNWNLLIMRKRNPIPQKNNTFLADVEYLFCIREPGAYWKNDCPYDYYRRVRDVNVKPSEFGHPTEKQVSFIEPYFEISSKPNDLIVDFFCGSGTTLIVCEKINRRCFGMELDEKYCDVIIKRWEQFTGKKATLEPTGQTYDQLKQERDNA